MPSDNPVVVERRRVPHESIRRASAACPEATAPAVPRVPSLAPSLAYPHRVREGTRCWIVPKDAPLRKQHPRGPATRPPRRPTSARAGRVAARRAFPGPRHGDGTAAARAPSARAPPTATAGAAGLLKQTDTRSAQRFAPWVRTGSAPLRPSAATARAGGYKPRAASGRSIACRTRSAALHSARLRLDTADVPHRGWGPESAEFGTGPEPPHRALRVQAVPAGRGPSRIRVGREFTRCNKSRGGGQVKTPPRGGVRPPPPACPLRSEQCAPLRHTVQEGSRHCRKSIQTDTRIVTHPSRHRIIRNLNVQHEHSLFRIVITKLSFFCPHWFLRTVLVVKMYHSEALQRLMLDQ